MPSRTITGLLLSLLPASAWAQGALLQGGAPVTGQAPMYSGPQGGSQAVVQASGPAGGGGIGLGLNEILQVSRVTGTGPYGTHVCSYSAPITSATGYYYFCADASTGGRGLMAYGSGGGASPQPFQFCINATCYDFPFAVGGIVGPPSTTVGHVAAWGNTQGTLLADLGGGLALTGLLSVAPPINTLTQAFNTVQTTSGSVSSAFWANQIVVNDSVDAGTEASGAVLISTNYGNGKNGGHSGLGIRSYLASASGAGNTNRNYVGIHALAAAQASDGGTGGGSQVNWKGAIFGFGAEGVACGTAVGADCPNGTAATNLLELTGGEINIRADAGSSIWYKAGLTITAVPTDAVQGTTWDCAFCLSNQIGAVGWKDGILVGPMNGLHPLASTGTMLRSISGSYANGIDFSTDTISGNAFRSPGVTITGVGAATFAGALTSGPLSATTGEFSGAVLTGPLTATGNSGVVGNFNVTGTANVGSNAIISGTLGVVGTTTLNGLVVQGGTTANFTGAVTLPNVVTASALPTSSGGKCVGITNAGTLYISGATC